MAETMTKEEVEEVRNAFGVRDATGRLTWWGERLDAVCDAALVGLEAKRDAERYQRLRSADPDNEPYVCEQACNDWGTWYDKILNGEELDSAIDAAIEEQKK